MAQQSGRSAWMQAAALVTALVVLSVVLVSRLKRPFDRDTLAIQVEQLQSQSAEAALLARNAMNDRLAPGFVRQHVRQLADAASRVQDALQSKPADPGLAPALVAARQSGVALQAILQSWSADAGRASQAIPDLDNLVGRLRALDHQIKPGN